MVQVFTLGTEEVQINVFVKQECTTKDKKYIGYTSFFKKWHLFSTNCNEFNPKCCLGAAR